MLDMGFTPQIEVILKFIPKNHQTLLFSATLPENILKISQKYLNNPERISVGSLSTPIEKIKQETFEITTDKKYHELINQLVERSGSILVFVKTKHGADKIVKRLKYDGHKADAIHGNLRQSKRDRVIRGFRNGNSRILVATDVAARGLDIPVIKHVINYDLPQVPEDYIHRIGRTGRAGKDGSALTFLTNSDRNMWRSIQKLIDPNFKTFQEIEKNRSKKNKKGKKSFNKKKNFRDKNKFFKKEDRKKSSFNKNKKFSKKDDNKRSNFKDKKKSFNKDHKRSKFKKKETTVGYTNNPKYFSKKQENPMENENFKQKSFKKKNKFKNRKRPKNFSFKKHKRK
jgi:superfamily II DNA/RNA helicase